MNKQTLILAIDTSCDETSAAITSDRAVLSNVIASQTELHRKWGGVVPDIAKRAHQENIDLVIKEAFARASKNIKRKIDWNDINYVAATYGPGLAIALEVGLQKAQELAQQFGKHFIAVNHMEGHLLSCLAADINGKSVLDDEAIKYPGLGVLISGKHTEIVNINNIGNYEVVADTLDDAIGEAYDKVGRMLGLGYPGGSTVAEFAKKGDPLKYSFPIPLKNDSRLAFSYSGLKTAVFYTVKEMTADNQLLTAEQICDLCASFERAATMHLLDKLNKCIVQYKPNFIFAGGGVSANASVRKKIRELAKVHKIKVHFPRDKKLFMDNAAMIGVAAFYKAQRGIFDTPDKDRVPRAKLGIDQ